MIKQGQQQEATMYLSSTLLVRIPEPQLDDFLNNGHSHSQRIIPWTEDRSRELLFDSALPSSALVCARRPPPFVGAGWLLFRRLLVLMSTWHYSAPRPRAVGSFFASHSFSHCLFSSFSKPPAQKPVIKRRHHHNIQRIENETPGSGARQLESHIQSS